MHPVLRRELGDGLFALERLQGHLGLELAAKLLSCHVDLLVRCVAFYLSPWSIFRGPL